MVLPLGMVGKGFGILKVFESPWEMDCLVGVAQGLSLFLNWFIPQDPLPL